MIYPSFPMQADEEEEEEGEEKNKGKQGQEEIGRH